MSDREMLSARVSAELKTLVDADSRPNQEVVEAALWREFGGERKGALERRIEEKRNRMATVDEEIEARQDEKATLRTELDALKSKLGETKDRRQEAFDELDQKHPDYLTTDNPVVQTWADRLDMTPAELLEAYHED